MKKWSHEEGEEFKNSDVCYGREYNPGSGTIDVAKISIRGTYPSESMWGYLEKSHEMAIVVTGEGFIESKRDGRKDLTAGDVVHVEPKERFRWGGNMDLIVPCGPAFDPSQHKMEEA
jgi:mannose-6-phosphate isomerase-like protein (cupin superfamily)